MPGRSMSLIVLPSSNTFVSVKVTVVPAKFPVFTLNPATALKSVDLPQLGWPASAMTSSSRGLFRAYLYCPGHAAADHGPCARGGVLNEQWSVKGRCLNQADYLPLVYAEPCHTGTCGLAAGDPGDDRCLALLQTPITSVGSSPGNEWLMSFALWCEPFNTYFDMNLVRQ